MFSMVTLAPNRPLLSQVFAYVTRHVAGGIAANAGMAAATTAHATIPATIAKVPRYRVLHRTTTLCLLRTGPRKTPKAEKGGDHHDSPITHACTPRTRPRSPHDQSPGRDQPS
ncbi:hypothetical protein ABZU32_13805 [Sphaerisporangium sp. NPDC005288]|uniref:hypothetical protein n=1 Tax=Sphaerisporangium sp. NPDC005288 TaxID=3155114 RepID=UPI0033A5D085